MRPILVGITGGVASGKKMFTRKLAARLNERRLKTLEVDHTHDKAGSCPNSADCILFHGLKVFEDPELMHQLDVKVFIDVDADLRLVRMMESAKEVSQLAKSYNTETRKHQIVNLMKMRKTADIWVDHISREKLDHIADLVISARNGPSEKEPIEVSVYLDKYEKAPDTPVSTDFA